MSRGCLAEILGGTEVRWVGLELFWLCQRPWAGRVPRVSHGAAKWDDVTAAGILAVRWLSGWTTKGCHCHGWRPLPLTASRKGRGRVWRVLIPVTFYVNIGEVAPTHLRVHSPAGQQ
jgi:hypothetical protein